MTARELAIVRAHIEAIFGDWHVCRLSKKDAKAMKLKPGTVCDYCRDGINAQMKSIREQTRETPI